MKKLEWNWVVKWFCDLAGGEKKKDVEVEEGGEKDEGEEDLEGIDFGTKKKKAKPKGIDVDDLISKGQEEEGAGEGEEGNENVVSIL